jgi:hypothetical protein
MFLFRCPTTPNDPRATLTLTSPDTAVKRCPEGYVIKGMSPATQVSLKCDRSKDPAAPEWRTDPDTKPEPQCTVKCIKNADCDQKTELCLGGNCIPVHCFAGIRNAAVHYWESDNTGKDAKATISCM